MLTKNEMKNKIYRLKDTGKTYKKRKKNEKGKTRDKGLRKDVKMKVESSLFEGSPRKKFCPKFEENGRKIFVKVASNEGCL